MKETFSRALGALDRARNEVSCRVEATAVGAKDAVLNRTNQITGTVAKTYYGVKGTVSWMVDVGIVVAAIAAPVPTAIGIGLLWVLENQIKAVAADIDESNRDREQKRKLQRVTSLLKKYGQIPESASLKTEYVSMWINSRTGTVDGEILSGEFKGRFLCALTESNLERLIEHSKDPDTKQILEGYLSLRRANAANLEGGGDD
ncbi:TPA: hypothetical protein ACP3ZG_000610 [Pseudomonas aeruginosa]|uniref:Uncharacterized protein n=1 Tax=Pseudomonas aeruginosa TaxID=287 RepID=A0A241XRE9_PSEAI|nr:MULTISPECIES: hypothetical protein [Pseudomonas]MBI6603649.1 hypothetical protein [Pseudomonas sp. S4_EA_1b]MBI8852227.1 hypothetical protein [Pseudomonas aeruginosa]OBY57022.1 hypothetical protein A9513_016035 [Pseudomonas sp. AU12215]OTI62994.1 hypothetical protein CAZ10_09100 [Pseudomonas aeruginosa]HDU2625763.1 hypothetical protein [Pseudomonas aeruginosa]